MVAPSRSFGRHLAYHPEAGPAVGVAGHEPEPACGAAAARLVQPAAAPDHHEEIVAEVGRHYSLVRALRVFLGAAAVVVGVVPVAAPLPYVAVHVVKAPGIGRVGADLRGPPQVGPAGGAAVGVIA